MFKNFSIFLVTVGLVYGQKLPFGDECSNQGNGKCKHFFDCPVAVQQVKQNEFHKLSRCGFSGLTELVCCPENKDAITTMKPDVAMTTKMEITEASTKSVTKRPVQVESTEANTKLNNNVNSTTKIPVAPFHSDSDVCNDRGIGKCISFFECPVAIKQKKQQEFHKLTRCGFSGLIELVCCPENNEVTTASTSREEKVTVTKRAATETVPIGSMCRDYGNGICMPFNECAVAIEQVKQNEFHNLTRCGFSGLTELVCCPENNVSETFIIDDKFAEDKRPAELQCDNIIRSFPPPTGSYIIGGVNASLGEFPHMAAIGFIKKDGSKINFVCGGSLISSRYVLTAAHCKGNWKSFEFRIRLGVIDKTMPNEDSEYNVTEIHTHPEYKLRSRYNDLTLFKLNREVPFTTYRHPICLYTMNDLPKTEVIVTGWGKTDISENTLSDYLLKARLSIIQANECGSFFQPQRTLENGITDKLLCALDPEKIKDSCQGDSGGPLQALTSGDGHFRLIGVTAFGKSCGGSTPGVYTNVQKNLDWIESVAWPEFFVSKPKDDMLRINL